MSLRIGVVATMVIGCHGSPPPAARGTSGPASAAASSPCVAQPAGDTKTADLDGDGTAEVLVLGYRDVTVYRRRGNCFEAIATLELEARVAFVQVLDTTHSGMRDLSIDTWLYHGDRARSTWSWSGGTYDSFGRPEEIPGPSRPRPRRP